MRILVFACCFALISPIRAADPPKNVKDAKWHKQLQAQYEKGTKYAVLIGIDKYVDRPIKGPIENVKLLQKILARHCGFQSENIVTLFDEAATREGILNAIKKAVAQLKPEDTILISFNGHGSEVDDKSYFNSIDREMKRTKETAVGLDEVRKILHECKASRKLVIIEACHSGGGNESPDDPSSQELSSSLGSADGVITFASCRVNQRSRGHNGQGIFSAILAEGLAGAADFDKNGIVDSDELYRHLFTEVPAIVKLLSPHDNQLPVRILGAGISGPVPLSKPDGKDDMSYLKMPPRPKPLEVATNSIGMKLVYLPSEVIEVGSPKTEYLRNEDEREQHVYINALAYMGAHEVTQDQYSKVMGKNPSYFSANGSGADAVKDLKTGDLPVEQVSWNDAVEFCKKLSALPEEKKAGRKYRLPTECEWEFACRARTRTTFSTGERLSSKQANIRGDKTYLDSEEGPTLGRTAPVGSYKPNAFGLYDMHGNVAEWCSDYYAAVRFPLWASGFHVEGGALSSSKFEAIMNIIDETKKAEKKTGAAIFAEAATPLNPKGPKEGETRVYRGGAFVGDVTFARSASRREKAADYTYRAIGFRVVCEPYYVNK